MRVVIVGTGIAGLVTAYRAATGGLGPDHRGHDIVLVTKDELAESNTKYAQGGIAVAMFPDDSVQSHIDDTLVAGAGLCDLHAVEVLCGEGPQRVRDLIELGVEFDRIANGEYARGHEAAHSHRRVLHAGGDATGLAIEVALLRAVKTLAVEVHEHTFLREVLVEPGPDGIRRTTGIEVIGPDGAVRAIAADAVVLASGGAGQLFQHTTNPEVTTGDGVAAAFRAGAAVGDVEFYQFHPTSLAVKGNPLVSEAVRGEGAVLLDEQGRRFMFDVHPDGELAPRDVVARGIQRQMAKQGGRPVVLDATALGAEFLAERFPGIDKVVRENGFDWGREPIPVTPAAHYWMGGVRTDDAGRTTIPGLYVVGEASNTGVHGANRLASNSLLESLVFAWRAADALDGPFRALEVDALDPADARAQNTPSGEKMSPRVTENDDFPPLDAEVGATAFTRAALRGLMWDRVGLERDLPGLREAAGILAAWAADGPDPVGTDPEAQEDRNLLDLGRLMVTAAIRREESRGAHDRTDFPETREEFAHRVAWAVPAERITPAEVLA
ncbi:MAG: L-aspartate oxidase [Actinomycetales bacterium]|nr:L-aspartate oxidase [Actinomycetales bacterium]